ncbi:MAG TPA: DUF308 domain-containing protein [Bacilli bacterium]|nr:DUF308 domain-containing protein [Bacilli bacterium]HQC83334.1 DUF308 domain-containing protein [Bacilli bacterium]
MISSIKSGERSVLLSTIATLVLGIILVIAPTASLGIITAIIAILFIAFGVAFVYHYVQANKIEKVVSFSLVIGILLIALGILMFLKRDALVNFVTVLIGIGLIIKALYKIQFSISLKDLTDKWKYNLVAGLLILTLGLILILYPNGSAETFLMVVGVIMIIGSIAELSEALYVFKSVNKVANEVDKVVKDLDFTEKDTDDDKEKKTKKSKK